MPTGQNMVRRLTLLVATVAVAAAAGCGSSATVGGGGSGQQAVPTPEVTAEVDDSVDDSVDEPDTRLVLEPLLRVVHGRPDAAEFESAVYIGAGGRAELVSLVAAAADASPDARVETALGLDDDAAHLIDETDVDEHFFVTAGHYCGSGGIVLDVAPAALELRHTEFVDCAVAAPVSSIFRVERTTVGDTFELRLRSESQDIGTVVARVEDRRIADDRGGEAVTLDPVLYVGHPSNVSAFEPALWIGADGKAELRRLVADALAVVPETRPGPEGGIHVGDLAVIDDADPSKYFFVTGGYYCTSGGMVLDVRPCELELRLTDVISCAEAQPVSSIFVVERAPVDPTFVLLERAEWEDRGTIVGQVVDWTVTTD